MPIHNIPNRFHISPEFFAASMRCCKRLIAIDREMLRVFYFRTIAWGTRRVDSVCESSCLKSRKDRIRGTPGRSSAALFFVSSTITRNSLSVCP